MRKKMGCSFFRILAPLVLAGLIGPAAQAQSVNKKSLPMQPSGATIAFSNVNPGNNNVLEADFKLTKFPANVGFVVEGSTGTTITYTLSFSSSFDGSPNSTAFASGTALPGNVPCMKYVNPNITFSSNGSFVGETMGSFGQNYYICPVVQGDVFRVDLTETAPGTSVLTLYAWQMGPEFSLSNFLSSGIAPSNINDPCQNPTTPKSSVVVNNTTTTQLVALSAGKSVFVCGFSFTVSGSATATAALEFGTGLNCVTGPTLLTGNFLGGTVPVLVQSSGGGYTTTKTTASQELCIVPGGATPSVQGVLTFVQQ